MSNLRRRYWNLEGKGFETEIDFEIQSIIALEKVSEYEWDSQAVQ